ncbi:thaumatin-like protein 1 [Abrus precatorius]|uniref:Thaumatin-like protein 1 n=1 Tax=Abrus precatorius TaxID=3816 RepID=A0A8B8M5Z6_ABRPR|nr:thaumatin-like protein 1 [Abrus precatorius]
MRELFLRVFSGVHCDVTFHFENMCSYSVWRGSNPSIGDEEPELGPLVYEIFNMDDHYSGSIWVRTGCSTNGSNYFSCETGDCGNGIMECAGLKPSYPVTLLNFNVNVSVVSYEVSLVHGQNVFVRIKPNGGTLVDGSGPCPMVDCNKDIGNVCPPSLISKNKGGLYVGCNSACDVLKDPKYCCNGDGCQPDEISQKYKQLCPLAHTYPGDHTPPVYRCKGADSYDVTFCPPL